MAARKVSKARRRKAAKSARPRRSTARKARTRRRATTRAPKRSKKAASKRLAARRSRPASRKTPRKKKALRAKPRPAAPAAGKKLLRVARPALLDRERRKLPDQERLGAARDQSDERLISSARAGHDELRTQLTEHTETSPVLTAGDVDAKWQDAYAVGDEAPGGDNPTPGQDRVDDIGKALGINYRPDEELQGGDEVAERDRHRWELDPASSEDWPHDKD
jgi:Family of unknown function (DUF6335)